MKAHLTRIVLIDDDPLICRLLRKMLENACYEVFDAGTGGEGIALTLEKKPELILLDVQLPDLDGFAVCEAMKTDERIAEIPVVFLTGDADPDSVARGLRLGAVDYVAKPPRAVELLMRVDLHVRLRDQELQLRDYSAHLEELVAERTKALIHADRLVSLGTLAAGTAHEINNPTSVIRGNVDTLRMYWTKAGPALEAQLAAGGDPVLQTVVDEMPAVLDGMTRATERIKTIVQGLLRFGARRPADKEPVDLQTVITEALELTHNKVKYHIQVHRDEQPLPPVLGGAQELSQVFVNLVTNAADAIGEKEGEITVSTEIAGDKLRIFVDDSGPGIPKDLTNRVTEPFFTTKDVGKGTGLGLPICIGIAEDHGGSLRLDNRPEGGCRATLELPLRLAEQETPAPATPAAALT